MISVEDILSQVTNYLENPNIKLNQDVILLAKDLQNTCLKILEQSQQEEGMSIWQPHTERQFILFQELVATLHPSLVKS